jgi:hypothetical protein
MTDSAIGRRSLLWGAAASVLVLPTAAHHGRGWAVDEQSELKGTTRSISMARRTRRCRARLRTVWGVR